MNYSQTESIKDKKQVHTAKKNKTRANEHNNCVERAINTQENVLNAPGLYNDWHKNDTCTNRTENPEANHKNLVYDISSISKSMGKGRKFSELF